MGATNNNANWGNFGMQIGAQAAAPIMDVAGSMLSRALGQDQYNDERQIKQQQALTDMQVAANKSLASYGYDLQQKMFDYTARYNSPEEMKKRIEAAGMNPAFMMSGTGSGVTGSVSAGTAAGGQAANAAQTEANNIARTQMGLQLAMQQAQIANVKADTKVKEVEADVTGGAGKDKLIAETNFIINQTNNEVLKGKLIESQTTAQDIANRISSATADTLIATANKEFERLEQEINKLKSETNYTNLKSNEQEIINKYTVQTIESNLALLAAQTAKEFAGARLSNAEADAIGDRLAQGWIQLAINEESNEIAKGKAIDDFNLEMKKIGIQIDKNKADFIKSPYGTAYSILRGINISRGGQGNRQDVLPSWMRTD